VDPVNGSNLRRIAHVIVEWAISQEPRTNKRLNSSILICGLALLFGVGGMLIANSFRLGASEKPDAPTGKFQLRDLKGQLINFDDVGMGMNLIRVQPTLAAKWQLRDLNGKSVQLSDFKGKVVVLNFWATWCPPCKAELPDLIHLQREFSHKGAIVVGISVDSLSPSGVLAFTRKIGINYPIVMGTEELSEQYGAVYGIPITYVIDRNGTIIAINPGLLNKQAVELMINQLLANSRSTEKT